MLGFRGVLKLQQVEACGDGEVLDRLMFWRLGLL